MRWSRPATYTDGGFAQAAYNIPDWFELAEAGYAKLGKSRAAQLVRDAITLLPEEISTLSKKGLLDGATIERVFVHFRESEMAALDERIPEDEWWIDEERVDYVRKHLAAFRKVA